MASPNGIRARHRSGCRAPDSGRCNCKPAYEAFIYLAREKRKVRKTFPSMAEAKAWRSDAQRP